MTAGESRPEQFAPHDLDAEASLLAALAADADTGFASMTSSGIRPHKEPG